MPNPVPVAVPAGAQLAMNTLQAIIARLCALNATDPQIIALLATWQAQTGQALQ